MLLIDKHKLKQKCNNFGYLSTKSWLKGNDSIYWKLIYEMIAIRAFLQLSHHWVRMEQHIHFIS